MNEHLSLPFAGEFSLGYRWRCPICKEELRSERSPNTKGKTLYFTRSGNRHYKSRCNLKTKEPDVASTEE